MSGERVDKRGGRGERREGGGDTVEESGNLHSNVKLVGQAYMH